VIKKLFKGLAVVAALLVLGSFVSVWYIGAWGIVFPSQEHESIAPEVPAFVKSPSLLLFTKTNRMRHKEAIRAGTVFFEQKAADQGWSVFHTENSAVFNVEDLSRFDVVVFHNATGDMLSDEQQLVFQRWLEQGGGWLGIHAAADGSHKDWPWYIENLMGAQYIAHTMGPHIQSARIINELGDHPVMAGIKQEWMHEEEWYSWEESPRRQGFTVLARVDEDSYSPVLKLLTIDRDLRMGDHPIVWSRCVGNGRSIYSALGHRAEAYQDPQYQKLLENAIRWMMDARPCRQVR
jgi:hypothetical protein